jgi:hypothetical protein
LGYDQKQPCVSLKGLMSGLGNGVFQCSCELLTILKQGVQNKHVQVSTPVVSDVPFTKSQESASSQTLHFLEEASQCHRKQPDDKTKLSQVETQANMVCWIIVHDEEAPPEEAPPGKWNKVRYIISLFIGENVELSCFRMSQPYLKYCTHMP